MKIMTTKARHRHCLSENVNAMKVVKDSLDIALNNAEYVAGLSEMMLDDLTKEVALTVNEHDELESFRALAAEVKYYASKWPKYAGEHMKRLAALCPEGREWTPDMTPS